MKKKFLKISTLHKSLKNIREHNQLIEKNNNNWVFYLCLIMTQMIKKIIAHIINH